MVIEGLQSGRAMSACQELAALVTRHTNGKGNGAYPTAINQLEFMREDGAPTEIGVIEAKLSPDAIRPNPKPETT